MHKGTICPTTKKRLVMVSWQELSLRRVSTRAQLAARLA